MNSEKSTSGAPAVRKAVQILDLLQNSAEQGNAGGESLTTISTALSLPKSTTYRVLTELTGAGYLTLDRPSGRYSLGPRLLSLGHAVRQQSGILKVAHPHMHTLAQELGETTKLSVMQEREAIVLFYVKGGRRMQITTDTGNRFPLHAGAASKVLLATLTDEHVLQYAESGLKRFTTATITDPNEVLNVARRVRVDGYARDDQEYMQGVAAVAVPLQDYTGKTIAALSVTFFASDDNSPKVDRILPPLRETARAISSDLGFFDSGE